jgi:hypothetical protein
MTISNLFLSFVNIVFQDRLRLLTTQLKRYLFDFSFPRHCDDQSRMARERNDIVCCASPGACVCSNNFENYLFKIVIHSKTQQGHKTSKMTRYFALDVECVATGRGHSDRTPCSVAVVNQDCEVVLQLAIKPSVPIFSCLTPFTGVKNPSELEGGVSLSTAIQEVKSLLRSDSDGLPTLVDQRPQGDIKWLTLERGTDYSTVFDLAPQFATTKQGYPFYFSLQQEAKILLDMDISTPHHDAVQDSLASMKLFHLLQDEPGKLQTFKGQLTRKAGLYPSTAQQLGFSYEGVCLSAMNPTKCTCNQPTLRS